MHTEYGITASFKMIRFNLIFLQISFKYRLYLYSYFVKWIFPFKAFLFKNIFLSCLNVSYHFANKN